MKPIEHFVSTIQLTDVCTYGYIDIDIELLVVDGNLELELDYNNKLMKLN
jgi:hypothetical protein